MKAHGTVIRLVSTSFALVASWGTAGWTQQLYFPDCVCNTSKRNGAGVGDSVSVYFANYVQKYPPGIVVSNIFRSCSHGFPGCDTNNYMINGGFRARIEKWESDCQGCTYQYKYFGVIVPNTTE
jgi:hypothetical protein